MKKSVVGAIIAIAIISGGAFYLKEKKAPIIKKYSAVKIGTSNARGYIEVDGTVEANDTRKVFVDKKLKVKDVFIQESDYIEKGQLLMTFDESERNNVKRNLEKEHLNLAKLKRDAAVEQELYKLGGSSLNYLKELQESIRKSELSIEAYMEDLEKTVENVISPVSGTVTSLTAQENYLVDTDSPLLEIADLSDMKIVLEIPEYEIKDIRIGQKLEIKPEVFEKNKSYQGTITKIYKISQTSKKTSENILQVEVKPETPIPHIVPGFSVSAVIYLDEAKRDITLPKTAVLSKDDSYFVVGVDEKGVVKKMPVDIKVMKGDLITIDEGIKDGMVVLTTPDEALKDGDKIEISIVPNRTSNMKREKKGNDKNRPPQ
jgi:RND family efflux transporter MFP subunit